MNIQRVFFALLVTGLALPAAHCEAQKLKLPNFLPFKKKSQEIKPIPLTDRSGQSVPGQASKDKGLFDFMKPQTRKGQSGFGEKSRSFFAKTGDEIDKFADGTRKFWHDAWNPPKAKKAWWNQSSESNTTNKQPMFSWPGNQKSAQTQPPPMPRTARQYQPGQPRHRFR